MPHRAVQVRFFAPPPELRRYFTTFHLLEIDLPDGKSITDRIWPEWGMLRFHQRGWPDAVARDGSRLTPTPFPVTGPSTSPVCFTFGSTRQWGIGFSPLGWAKFIRVPAGDLADAMVDGNCHPAFASFLPLARSLYGAEPDPQAELARIVAHFMARLDAPVLDEARITAVHAGLNDPDVATVVELVARAGVCRRTVERICHRAFGFPPKQLMRRERFMRSLAGYLRGHSRNWTGALDSHYHDQAQFVREFHQFMGMSPSQYSALPRPIIDAVLLGCSRRSSSVAKMLAASGHVGLAAGR